MSNKAAMTARLLDQIQVFIASSVLTNERIARSLGLSVVDLQAFGVIARSESPLTAGEISTLTELPTSTTTRVLDRLEQQGFIDRGADPGDRRRVVVRARSEITARFGVASDDNPYSEITASMNRVHERFTVDELRVVERYFEAVNADVP